MNLYLMTSWGTSTAEIWHIWPPMPTSSHPRYQTMDSWVCINGDISRVHAMKVMFAVENGNFFDMPGVWYRKILGYRIIPKNQEDGSISIDGERVPFQPFQAEVHKGLGTVLSKSGHMYEAPGPI